MWSRAARHRAAGHRQERGRPPHRPSEESAARRRQSGHDGGPGSGTLDYVEYPSFRCRISETGGRLRFTKLTGSQRHVGLLFPADTMRQVFLGTLVLGNEQRLMILCNLVSGPLSVGQLNQRVPLSQSALSQHLGMLRVCGVVTTTRESQSIIYSLPPSIATRVIGLLHEEFCAHLYGRANRSHS